MSEFQQRKKDFMEAFKKELSNYKDNSPQYEKMVLERLDSITRRFFTLSEIEYMLGITETINDCPDDYVSDNEFNFPEYEDGPDYEQSHRDAKRAMAWLKEHGIGK